MGGMNLRLVVSCVAVAAVSLVLSSTPRFDAGAWVLWGKELTDANVPLSTVGGPSWKPLPVVFTTIFSLFGAAAPALWVLTARVGAVVALVFAYRVGKRLGGTEAGLAASLFLLLTGGWLGEVGYGGEAGILLALLLGALDRHFRGRPTQAFALGAVAALLRVEVWPFLGLYALWLAWRTRESRPFVAAALLSLPLLWFGPDWVTNGEPFRASRVARSSAEAGAVAAVEQPALAVLVRAYESVPLPVHLLALVAVACAFRRHERTVLVLAAGALAWVTLVLLMTTVGGYAGLPRFMVPAAALVCVLAALGATELTEVARHRMPRIAVGAGLLAVLVPFGVPRAEALAAQARDVQRWERSAEELEKAVQRVGGPVAVACQQPTVNHTAAPRLAWILGVPLGAVATRVRPGALVFYAKQHAGRPPALPDGRVTVARVGVWTVYSIGSAPGERATRTSRCPDRFAGEPFIQSPRSASQAARGVERRGPLPRRHRGATVERHVAIHMSRRTRRVA